MIAAVEAGKIAGMGESLANLEVVGMFGLQDGLISTVE